MIHTLGQSQAVWGGGENGWLCTIWMVCLPHMGSDSVPTGTKGFTSSAQSKQLQKTDIIHKWITDNALHGRIISS